MTFCMYTFLTSAVTHREKGKAKKTPQDHRTKLHGDKRTKCGKVLYIPRMYENILPIGSSGNVIFIL